jgi:hypothetical protein
VGFCCLNRPVLASKAKTKSSQIGDPFQIFALLRGADAKGAGGEARRHPKRFVTIRCRGDIARRRGHG